MEIKQPSMDAIISEFRKRRELREWVYMKGDSLHIFPAFRHFKENLSKESLKEKNIRPNYVEQTLKKKNGGHRHIFIPDDLTMLVQKIILSQLKKINYEFSPCIKAFMKNTSILDNAKSHLKNPYLIHYDLRDFFDTVYFDKISGWLKKNDVDSASVKIIKKWCFWKGHLPQGAPTSPFLSNIACENLDKRFLKLAEKLNATYTRYADDIIISGEKNIIAYQTIFKRIIRTEKFFINHRKTRISVLDSEKTRGEFPNAKWFVPYHVVTGLTVNDEKVTVRPNYLNEVWRELKALLPMYYPFTDFDVYEEHSDLFWGSVQGKICFVCFVDPEEGKKLIDYIKKTLPHYTHLQPPTEKDFPLAPLRGKGHDRLIIEKYCKKDLWQ